VNVIVSHPYMIASEKDTNDLLEQQLIAIQLANRVRADPQMLHVMWSQSYNLDKHSYM